MTTIAPTKNRITIPDPETGEPVSWVECTEQEWADLPPEDSVELCSWRGLNGYMPIGVFFRREQDATA